MSPERREQIAEEIHHIQDLLHGEDRVLEELCERMLDRLDILAGARWEDYE